VVTPAPAFAAVDRRHDRFLRITDVRVRTGLSAATIWRRESAGTFPSKVKLGPRSVGWYQSDVDQWVADPDGYRRPVPAAC
jgi:prophage regulatory protein